MNSRTEIMQLSSGREIDVLVAEQIMGWQIETDELKRRKLRELFSGDKERQWWRAPEGGWYCDPPSYSSEVAAVWRIVELMNKRGQFLFLSQNSEKYEVAFDEPRAINHDYIAEENVNLAICKAALAVAAGGKVGVCVGIEQRTVPATALTSSDLSSEYNLP
jgi:Phage ABA sandwich domain